MPSDDVFIDLITETKKSVGNLVKYAAGITAAIAVVRKMVKVAKDLEQAFFKQEKAEAKLASAIRATGKETSISITRMKLLASSLQEVTTFGDEATLSAMAMLQQLADLTQDGLEKVTPAVLDFAAAMDIDLQTAATLIGKTLGSSTNALTRYGVEVDMSGTKSEKLAAITQALNDKFGGTAVALGQTAFGAAEKLTNAMGDLKEEMGRVSAEGTTGFKTWLTGVITDMTTATQVAAALAATWSDFQLDTDAPGGKQLADYTKRIDDLKVKLDQFKIAQKETRGVIFIGAIPLKIATPGEIAKIEAEINGLSRGRAKLMAGMNEVARAAAEATAAQILLLKGSKDYMATTKVLQTELVLIAEREKALGDTYDDSAAQAAAYLVALETLITKGYKFELLNIQTLISTYGHLAEAREDAAAPLADVIPFDFDKFEGTGDGGGANSHTLFLRRRMERQTAFEDEVKQVEELTEKYTEWGMIAANIFGKLVTDLASGEDAYESFGKAAKNAVVVILKSLGQQMVVQAAVSLALGFSGNIPQFAAAAQAGIAATAAFAGAGIVQALGSGGIVTRPTLALIGEKGPEKVTPLTGPNRGGDTFVTHIHAGTILAERGLRAIIQDEQRRSRSRRVH